MTEDDLFDCSDRPAKARSRSSEKAVRNLKLVTILNGVSQTLAIYEQRILVKRGQRRAPFIAEVNAQKAALHDPLWNFDIENLADNGKLEIHNSLLNVVLYDKPEVRSRD